MTRVTINNWNGGQAEDVYNADKNFFQRAVHLDNFTRPGRLRPYSEWVQDDTNANEVDHLLYASDGVLYGLGQVSGGNQYAVIFEKTPNTLSSNWSASTNGTAGTGS